MLKVGLTGNIGSGKTFVAKIFQAMGIPVYNSDLQAKHLMSTDPKLKTHIINLLGPQCYENDILQTQYIAQKVFNNDVLLAALNQLVHPAVHKSLAEWFILQQGSAAPYALQEAAIIIESGGYRNLDKIILVIAPKSLRLNRIQLRDKHSIIDIKNRMDKQMPENKKIPFADFVIHNDGKALLLPQILKVHEILSHLITPTKDN